MVAVKSFFWAVLFYLLAVRTLFGDRSFLAYLGTYRVAFTTRNREDYLRARLQYFRPTTAPEWLLAGIALAGVGWACCCLIGAWLGDDAPFLVKLPFPGLNRILAPARRGTVIGTVVSLGVDASPTVDYTVAGKTYRIRGAAARTPQFRYDEPVTVMYELRAPHRAFIARRSQVAPALTVLALSLSAVCLVAVFCYALGISVKYRISPPLPVAKVAS